MISREYGRKMFQSRFDNFSGSGTIGAGKVQNTP